jgi:hypothetical protein
MEHPPTSLVASALDPRSGVDLGHVAAAMDDRVEVREVVPGEAVADRYVAPGGWRRALLGFLIGLLAGGVVALLLPRDDGPRRRDLRATGLPGATPVATTPADAPAASDAPATGDAPAAAEPPGAVPRD